MQGEDDVDRLLRAIRERKGALKDKVIAGVPIDPVRGGYLDLIGEIRGLEWAEDQVLEQLRGHFSDEQPARDLYQTT